MGQVYRARDTTLNRDVALKILPDSFANDPDRLARFTREAQTLASLNHPNIAHIHGLEESGGMRALRLCIFPGCMVGVYGSVMCDTDCCADAPANVALGAELPEWVLIRMDADHVTETYPLAPCDSVPDRS